MEFTTRLKNYFHKPKVVGLIGVIGAGKDHTADKMVFNDGFIKISFAEPLKFLAIYIFGSSINGINTDKFKYYNIFLGFFKSVITGRQFLQRLGDGIRMFIGDDTWINIMDSKIESHCKHYDTKYRGIVIPDVRYLNEAEYVLSIGGSLRFCNYESIRYDFSSNHISEQLAQAILAMGYEDGDLIDLSTLRSAKGLMEEVRFGMNGEKIDDING